MYLLIYYVQQQQHKNEHLLPFNCITNLMLTRRKQRCPNGGGERLAFMYYYYCYYLVICSVRVVEAIFYKDVWKRLVIICDSRFRHNNWNCSVWEDNNFTPKYQNNLLLLLKKKNDSLGSLCTLGHAFADYTHAPDPCDCNQEKTNKVLFLYLK